MIMPYLAYYDNGPCSDRVSERSQEFRSRLKRSIPKLRARAIEFPLSSLMMKQEPEPFIGLAFVR
jgi:hypothetical protein